MMPLSDRLTLSTSLAWLSMSRLRWMTPKPPSRAKAMARLPSVTVSMAALTSGILSRIFFVSHVDVSTSPGITFDKRGTRETSSKVMASPANFSKISIPLRDFPKIISEPHGAVQLARDQARQQFRPVIRRFLRQMFTGQRHVAHGRRRRGPHHDRGLPVALLYRRHRFFRRTSVGQILAGRLGRIVQAKSRQ